MVRLMPTLHFSEYSLEHSRHIAGLLDSDAALYLMQTIVKTG